MKKRKKIKRDTFPYVLIVLGLGLVSVWAIHKFFYYRSITPILLSVGAPAKPLEFVPTAISIGSMQRLPVVESQKINGIWSISPNAANHVLQSAVPGTLGNIIIFGHNTKKVLRNLRKVHIGETIKLTTANGAQFSYRVISTQKVSPSHIDLLAPTKNEVLTIYTCTGLLDSKRLVVRAVPI